MISERERREQEYRARELCRAVEQEQQEAEAMPKPKKKRKVELVCCEVCGRDTTNRSRICGTCIGAFREDADDADFFEIPERTREDEVNETVRDAMEERLW